MDIMTHAKFRFIRLMLTLIFGIRASEPPLGPGKRLKRPGLIGLKSTNFSYVQNAIEEYDLDVVFVQYIKKHLSHEDIYYFNT